MRVRLRNLGTTNKKSSRKIKYKKIPRVHEIRKEGAAGAKAFLKHFQIPAGVKVIAIGPVTGKALREAGVIPYMTGNSYDIPGILKGLTEEKTR